MYEDETTMSETVAELIRLNHRLLTSIAEADWDTYTELCDPTLSCFEPEARGHLVEGMEFHQYYFNLPAGPASPRHTTLVCPHVRLLGENVAVVSYVRLTQKLDATGAPQSAECEETRVWERQDGVWRHVHFHRSMNA